MNVTVKATVDEVTQGLEQLKGRIKTRTRQAINDAGKKARTATRRKLIEEIKPRVKRDVNSVVTYQNASALTMTGVVRVKEKGIGIEKVKDSKITSFLKKQSRGGKRRVIKLRFRGKIIKGAFKPKGLKEGAPKGFIAKPAAGKFRTGNRKFERVFAFDAYQETRKKRIFQKIEQHTITNFEETFRRLIKLDADKLGL